MNPPPTGSQLIGVSSSNNQVVAVGSYGSIVTTTDYGAAWVTHDAGTTIWFSSVVLYENRYVAVGKSGAVITSQDGGVTWLPKHSGTANNLRSVIYIDDSHSYAAVGYMGTIIVSGDGGETWVQRNTGTTNNLFGIAQSDRSLWAVGESGTIIASGDGGETWAQQNSGTTNTLYGITSGNGVVWAVGESGTILHSNDKGETWTVQKSGTARNLFGASCNGYQVVAVGESGTIVASSDGGETWTGQNSGTTSLLNGVTWGGDRFWAVGESGTILTSPPFLVNIYDIAVTPSETPQARIPFHVAATASNDEWMTFNVTVTASNPYGHPVYYKFYYCANYGTSAYATTPWTVVQEYSTSNTAQYTFNQAGKYVIVVRAVTDPDNEPAALPIVGHIVDVGGLNEVTLTGLSKNPSTASKPGETIQFTANAVTYLNDIIYYKFYYCANYGTADYSTTPWTVVQDYSTDNTCNYTFPSAGDYVVVVRAVTDPDNEPAALPIVGQTVTVTSN